MLKFKDERRLGNELQNVVDFRVKALLEDLAWFVRNTMQKDVVITCLIRTAEENKAVNGVPNSAHLSGRAADIRSTIYTEEEIGVINAYLTKIWGPLVYFKWHNSGSGMHIHININKAYAKI